MAKLGDLKIILIGVENKTLNATKIVVVNRNNKDICVYINGEKVEEKFLPEGVKTEMRYNKNFKVTLEKDEYYVLGDNRANSTDSRVFGPIKKSQIKGVGLMVFAGCSTVTKDGSCKGLKLKWPKVVK